LAGAGLGRIFPKNGRILDLPEPTSGTTVFPVHSPVVDFIAGTVNGITVV